MMFDTDVMIWFLRRRPAAVLLVDREPLRRLSIVSLMELLQGAKSKREAAEIRRFLRDNDFDVVAVDESTSHAALAFIEEHAQADGLQIPDALIAATALQTGDVLATANVRHFRRLHGLELKHFRPD
ncbi:MAG TPA: type II toxin-antitoxin system VapC family toxin [Bryobacteraceae bacterium]|nr:type II toxin-antitoxin system VapC family toxin [Bryobacteraceae bacterium]